MLLEGFILALVGAMIGILLGVIVNNRTFQDFVGLFAFVLGLFLLVKEVIVS